MGSVNHLCLIKFCFSGSAKWSSMNVVTKGLLVPTLAVEIMSFYVSVGRRIEVVTEKRVVCVMCGFIIYLDLLH